MIKKKSNSIWHTKEENPIINIEGTPIFLLPEGKPVLAGICSGVIFKSDKGDCFAIYDGFCYKEIPVCTWAYATDLLPENYKENEIELVKHCYNRLYYSSEKLNGIELREKVHEEFHFPLTLTVDEIDTVIDKIERYIPGI